MMIWCKQELDVTVSTMLLKTADTNHFIRDDAMKSLDAMIESIPAQKALAVLTSQGTRCVSIVFGCSVKVKE